MPPVFLSDAFDEQRYDVTFSDVFTDSLVVLKLGGLEEPQSIPADSGIITKLELGLPDSPWRFSGNIQWGADQNPEELEKCWEKSPTIHYVTQ